MVEWLSRQTGDAARSRHPHHNETLTTASSGTGTGTGTFTDRAFRDRVLALTRALGVFAAAKASRIVVVFEVVGAGAVAAALAVLEGIHEEATHEGSLGIGHPLVEIADQIEYSVLVVATA